VEHFVNEKATEAYNNLQNEVVTLSVSKKDLVVLLNLLSQAHHEIVRQLEDPAINEDRKEWVLNPELQSFEDWNNRVLGLLK
jgi:hypothetical protein